MSDLIDLLLHTDRYLLDLAARFGPQIYAVLFFIIFAETGFVVTPFLPGDSLLFAAGAVAAVGAMDLGTTASLIIAAAFLGNAVNYTIGRSIGHRIVARAQTDPRWARWIRPAYVARAHEFFEHHGGKAVVLGRFVPIVRTFVPFVAGIAEMRSHAFAIYNLVGSVAWVGICVGAGYLFGNVPIVRENFSLVALGIVFVSLLPMFFEYLRYRRTPSPTHSRTQSR